MEKDEMYVEYNIIGGSNKMIITPYQNSRVHHSVPDPEEYCVAIRNDYMANSVKN